MAAGWSRRWGLLAGGSPARRLLAGRGACVLLRDVPVTCRAWGSVSRSARSMSAALSRRSLCLPSAGPGGASLRSRPRRGSSPTRPPGEGCVADPSLASTPSSTSRGGRGAAREDNQNAVCPRGSRGCANRADRAVSSPRAACAAASRRPQPNAIAEKAPWARSSRPSPPPRRSPSRACPATGRRSTATGRRRRAASRRRARRRAPRSKMWK